MQFDQMSRLRHRFPRWRHISVDGFVADEFTHRNLITFLQDRASATQRKLYASTGPFLIPDLQNIIWSYVATPLPESAKRNGDPRHNPRCDDVPAVKRTEIDNDNKTGDGFNRDRRFLSPCQTNSNAAIVTSSSVAILSTPNLYIDWNSLTGKGEVIRFRGDPSSSTLDAWLCGVHLRNHVDRFKHSNLWGAGKRVTRVVDEQKDFDGLCMDTFDRLCLMLRELDDQLIVEREREVATSHGHNPDILASYHETTIELNRILQSNDLFSGIFAYFHEECARKVAHNEKVNKVYHAALDEFYRKRKRDSDDDGE